MSTSLQHPLPPFLPYDVLLCVIETLLAECSNFPERIDVLQTFSLVSQSFVIFCQKKLFRRFNMGRTDGKKCYSILENSPRLIPYVEEVWMYLGSQGVHNVSVAEMEVLRVLTSLRHLSVASPPDPVARYAVWQYLSLSVRQTINYLLLRPQITSFVIMGVQALPFPLLSAFRHLKSLDIRDENSNTRLQRDSEEEDTDEEDDGPDFSRLSLSSPQAILGDSYAIRLENLSLIMSDNILLLMLLELDDVSDDELNNSLFIPPPIRSPAPDRANGLEISAAYRQFNTDYALKITSHFDFTELRSFTLDITEDNLLPAFNIIHHARHTLTTLDVRQRYLDGIQQDPFGFNSNVNNLPDPLADEISLAPLTNLQHLSITILILAYMPVHLNSLSSWYSLLRKTPRGIRTLELTLDAFYFDSVLDLLPWFPNLDDDDDVANTPLSTLDEILSSSDSFPCLEFVRVFVKLPEDDRTTDSEPDMTVDVVDEEDLPVFNAWAETYKIFETGRRSSSPSDITDDVVTDEDLAMYEVMGDNYDPDYSDSTGTNSSYIRTNPSFSEGSLGSRPYPVPFERVEESISQMLRFTAKRLRSTKSFVVEVDFGTHVGAAVEWAKRARPGTPER